MYSGRSPYEYALSNPIKFIDPTGMGESNMRKLEEIGIRSNDISVWFYKPYEEQCNMEFTPHEMNRLSKNGITLCISCWKTI